jgi:hypothetical protein
LIHPGFEVVEKNFLEHGERYKNQRLPLHHRGIVGISFKYRDSGNGDVMFAGIVYLCFASEALALIFSEDLDGRNGGVVVQYRARIYTRVCVPDMESPRAA